mmetsp:Transcript_20098/g.45493  ORF Transcript_20098/g.45493 Transcript_20098/m.45493 type:complete len:223 (+) Transcript_20098:81-749(+)|eukprot:CAMPEP_0172611402 /NCGR_PEP_ID=MMETSP1068-20121228/31094_1 /TAXON_ID=35684 /ORGANISM="Pseudopedinella elastica, Strain CCMP716" /LENGTH=222 /DNA_ID=CAMNT_0013415363 /DNA_START=78 /DNA_END=746 /DNA_ORIENTATION=-
MHIFSGILFLAYAQSAACFHQIRVPASPRFGGGLRTGRALSALSSFPSSGSDAEIPEQVCRRGVLSTLAAAAAFSLGSTRVGAQVAGEPFFVSLDVIVDEEDGTKGKILIEILPEWAPLAAERFRELVELEFYKEARFYRTLPGYIAQFGIAADPELNKEWLCTTCKRLPDEPRLVSNKKGTVSFASGGKNTRQTQVFINLADNGAYRTSLMGWVLHRSGVS